MSGVEHCAHCNTQDPTRVYASLCDACGAMVRRTIWGRKPDVPAPDEHSEPTARLEVDNRFAFVLCLDCIAKLGHGLLQAIAAYSSATTPTDLQMAIRQRWPELFVTPYGLPLDDAENR